jgi:plastocyanin
VYQTRAMLALVAAAVSAGCGSNYGDQGGSGPDPNARAAVRAQPSGDGQTGIVGQDLANPLRIVVIRGDAPEAGAVVTWSGSGSLTPAVDTTGSDGISTSLWHLGAQQGVQTAQASVAGGADGSPVSFTATATAVVEDVLRVVRGQPSGDEQSGTVGQNLTNPLRIVVLRGNAPQAGAIVTWSTSGTGASLTPAVDTTGPDGVSTSVWHLGAEAGTRTAQASVAGGADGSPVSFTARAAAPAPSNVEIKLLNANRFDPANITIAAGTRVTWTWVGGFHDVTSAGTPGFASSGNPVSPPKSYSLTFNNPGTYVYFCSVHGSPTSGMRGTIVVQ